MVFGDTIIVPLEDEHDVFQDSPRVGEEPGIENQRKGVPVRQDDEREMGFLKGSGWVGKEGNAQMGALPL